jgi:hypothetical protein
MSDLDAPQSHFSSHWVAKSRHEMRGCYVGESVCFVQSGFNESGANKSGSILIHYDRDESIYTQNGGLMTMVIKRGK